jgi:hypothetical protein
MKGLSILTTSFLTPPATSAAHNAEMHTYLDDLQVVTYPQIDVRGENKETDLSSYWRYQIQYTQIAVGECIFMYIHYNSTEWYT